ncbi:penicillin acylase family protein [Pigmentiphaga litoralis]|uniref:Acyl-homoserine-lactone acylase n=1 Tax=Pigmentiphaga litoralis TaxID=516702 RepID=A0A7Y9LMM3_9BURK|nr:penicillin acylase family protein [Pigmentiphaga litoralis]NYE25989.1 acyl-homoserine-lactone acylase [Pigmentiphaga litoralis]NYE85109.1 acyl-homoserine-lactone acylase [Pigmentiphaga litoralis]
MRSWKSRRRTALTGRAATWTPARVVVGFALVVAVIVSAREVQANVDTPVVQAPERDVAFVDVTTRAPDVQESLEVPNLSVLRGGAAGVEIRRTTDGIPHIRGTTWRALGVGVGYVQAEDALCTLAEAFVTYQGRRSLFFGPDARPARDSTFGRPRNVDLDFFFRAFVDGGVLARYRAQHPPGLAELVDGFAEGYNRYVANMRARRGGVASKASSNAPGRACADASWVREISADDVHRRLYAAQIAGGYAKFITEMTNVTPAKVGAPVSSLPGGATSMPAAIAPVHQASASAATLPALGGMDRGNTLRRILAHGIGTQAGIGSNALALGSEATGGDGAVLFGNPHWFWGGPDRFYQMHLTIPGRVDVAGVGFLGVPLVMIGFNDDVAWTHTVSTARRFGLFDLTLDPADPQRYQVDGQSEPMTAREVSVYVREADGKIGRVTRTFYGTRFGPVVNLDGHHPSLGWGGGHVMAIRDVNADNFRIFRNFFFWNQATSLDDFVAIQRREAAVPWVNTVAIGRKRQQDGTASVPDGRVWYADIGAVPNVPDALRKACSTARAQGFAQLDAATPVLDGSRSACGWQVSADAAQAGAMPVDGLPSLMRMDYVANMNDSHWLSNARQPLEGFPAVMGGEREPLTLRGRLGHRIALDILAGSPGSSDATARRVMADVLTPRAYSADVFKTQVLTQACAAPIVQVDAQALVAAGLGKGTDSATPRSVDVGKACNVLRQWSNLADATERGALLWEAFWARLTAAPRAGLYADVFSSATPLDAPRVLNAEGGRAAQALALTVAAFDAQARALDEPLQARRYVESGGRRWPVYGGCASTGYFTMACNEDGQSKWGPDAMGNSYLQVVRFGTNGVDAQTLLAHGQDEAALTGGRGVDPVARYSRKAWLRFPFREADIARDPGLRRVVLPP